MSSLGGGGERERERDAAYDAHSYDSTSINLAIASPPKGGYFQRFRELGLWQGNLRLLSIFESADFISAHGHLTNAVSNDSVVRLWKSFIYRVVPDHCHAARNSAVNRFLQVCLEFRV